MMKSRLFLLLAFMMMGAVCAYGQSMTDEQVIQFVQKEQAAGEVKYSSYSFADISNHWAANYIEFLYTDEAEHQEEIHRLWENRRKRLAK